MIQKEQMHCKERGTAVDVLVEVKQAGRAGSTRTCLNCMAMTGCAPTAFCRFVNPLTTRSPLEALSAAGTPAN